MEHNLTEFPLVTVVTPTYQAERHIERCINSIKNQDYPNIEHIIVDGHSSDNTLEIIKKHNIKYLSERDNGVYHAMSKGVYLARGEFIHILNADDYYCNDQILKRLILFIQHNDLDVCHGYVNLVNSKGETKTRFGKDITKRELIRKMRVAHPSVIVRSDVYKRYGYFSECFRIAGDQDWLIRIWDKLSIGFYPNTVVNMELGGKSVSNVERSYRESMAIAILNDRNIIFSMFNYYYERLKHKLFFERVLNQ